MAKLPVPTSEVINRNTGLLNLDWVSFFTRLVSRLGNTPLLSGLATVATTGLYSDLLSRPTFATVATTGAYADLSGKPLIATVLAASALAVSHTGDTSETPLATITVPANAMGANGFVEVDAVWSYTNSDHAKDMRTWFGSSVLTDISMTATIPDSLATELARQSVCIHNRGFTNSQCANALLTVPSAWSMLPTALPTSAIDTTSSVNVMLTAQLGSAAETITLEAYVVRVFHAS